MSFRVHLGRLLTEDVEAVGWVEHGDFSSIELPAPQDSPTVVHIIFSALPAEIPRVESVMGKRIPDGYKAFLSEINGARLFIGENEIAHLALSGVWPEGVTPHTTARHLPNNDLLTNNHYSRPVQLPPMDMVAGMYAWDGTYVCLSPDGGVYARPRAKQSIIGSWPTFESFLTEEVMRLRPHFDRHLVQIDGSRGTSPSYS